MTVNSALKKNQLMFSFFFHLGDFSVISTIKETQIQNKVSQIEKTKIMIRKQISGNVNKIMYSFYLL